MAKMSKEEFIQQWVIHKDDSIQGALNAWDQIELASKTKPKPKQEYHAIEYYDIKIPTNKRDEFYSPKLDLVEVWVDCYQAIDVDYQLKTINLWCRANQTKRKTKEGMKRFINTWLSKAQNNPSQHKGAVKASVKPEPKSDEQKQKEFIKQKIREAMGGINRYRERNQTDLIGPLEDEVEELENELIKLEG